MFATIGKSALAMAATVGAGVLTAGLVMDGYNGLRRVVGATSLSPWTASKSSSISKAHSSKKKSKAKKVSARRPSPAAIPTRHRKAA